MLPLEGITVVAFEQAVAAPLATRNLAALGARVIKVIKVERVGGGDLARGYDHVVNGTGAHFVWLNRGKESLAVDLKRKEGRDAVTRLVAGADVVVENLAPGAAARLGVDASTLRAEHRGLIVASLSGYGTGGPLGSRKAYDMLIQADSGLISLTGTPEHPAKTGIPTADIASGMYLAQSILAALLRRLRTGEGATIEVSLLEATVEWMGHALYTQLATGRQPERRGVGHSAIAPYDRYPTADGEILIGVQTDSGWRSLVTEVLDAPGLAADPRFLTNVDRVTHRAECDEEVARLTRRWTTAELDHRLSEAGVPPAQLKDLADVVDHEQLRARDRWREIEVGNGTVQALLPPGTFSDIEAPMGAVPALGEHTRRLLAEAGLDTAAVEAALASGVAFQADVDVRQGVRS